MTTRRIKSQEFLVEDARFDDIKKYKIQKFEGLFKFPPTIFYILLYVRFYLTKIVFLHRHLNFSNNSYVHLITEKTLI